MTADPVPDVPLGTESQEASGFAVHGQLGWVVMVAVRLPPGMHGAALTGATEYSHAPLSPDWRTLNVWPATVIPPERSVTP